MEYKMSASLMCMDFLDFKQQLEILDKYMDLFHIDIIDGVYSKNLSLSPTLMEYFNKVITKPMDVHLATLYPEDWIELSAKAGAKYISLQYDVIQNQAFRLFQKIRDYNCLPGLVINPAITVEQSFNCLSKIDLLTIMMVDPGFPGQKFVYESLKNIEEAANVREKNNFSYKIQVDGSVNQNTYKSLIDAGADIFVLGSSGLFNLDQDINNACEIQKKDFLNAIKK